MLADVTDTGGMLAESFRRGDFAPLHWTEVEVRGLVITVAADAMKVSVDDRLLRLPVTYTEAIEILRGLDCISPTLEMCLQMQAQAKARPQFHGLVNDNATALKMKTLGFSRRFNEQIDDQLPADRSADELVFGPWKVWLLDAGIGINGAVNHGFWDQTRVPPSPVQRRGTRHNAGHYDYSQVLQPVRRMARRVDDGTLIDLLRWQGITSSIPSAHLKPYELQAPPSPTGPNRSPQRSAAGLAPAAPSAVEFDLAEVLSHPSLEVVAHEGWRTRGAADFSPQGIMLHHTAGALNGDAPSLGTCIHGRPDLAGPLCHILLARSGKVHLIAARRANHAGRGAEEVLQKVLLGELVEGDARDHGYTDAAAGGPNFYGIEVENNGLGEDYPDTQIRNLVLICAAICRAHGWQAERVIHHRQWTQRKPDMSYREDLVGKISAELTL